MSGPFALTPTPVFSPTQISNCSLWLDAVDTATITLSSGNVTSWRDKSGLGNNATAIGTIPFTSNINGLRTPAFTAIPNVYFTGTNVNTGAQLSAFSVYIQNTSSTGNNRILALSKPGVADFNNVTSVAAILRVGSRFDSYRNGSELSFVTGTFGVPSLSGTVFTGQSNTFFLNGSAGPTVASSGNFDYNTYQLATNFLEESGQNLNGTIGEVIIYNFALTVSQRQQVEGYLAWKWGLQANLPSNHPYRNTELLYRFPFPAVISPSINTVPLPSRIINDLVFNPRSISGCQLWLDGADSNTLTFSSGTNVSAWADKSGGGYNFTQTTSTRQPTYNATNRQLIFTGDGVQNSSANQALQNTSIPVAGTAYSIFAVARGNSSQPSFTGYNYVMAPAITFPQARLAFASLSGNFATFTGSGTSWNDTNANTPNISVRTSTRILCMVVSGSTLTPFYDGISMNTKVGTTGSFTGLVVGDAFSTDSGQCWNGSINEVLFYGAALTTFQRQQVEGYLAWKWGLTASLPNGHPYKIPPIVPFSYSVRNGAQRIFNPLFISNCQLWLDASKELRAGTITSITDLTSNGYVGSIVSASVQQRFLNNKTVWYFPSYTLRFNAFPWRTRFTLIFLVNTAGFVMSSQRVGGTGGYTTYFLSNNCYLFTVNGYSTLYGNDGSVAGSCGPDITPKNQWVIMVFAYNGGTQPSFYRFNGVNRTNVNTIGAGASDIIITDNMAINGSPSGTTDNSTNTYYAEYIHYNTGLSLSQVQEVEGYLAWKWGLQGSLPGNHPYKLWPPK